MIMHYKLCVNLLYIYRMLIIHHTLYTTHTHIHTSIQMSRRAERSLLPRLSLSHRRPTITIYGNILNT